MNWLIAALIVATGAADGTKTLDYEVFSNNQKIGVARYYLSSGYIRGYRIYGFLGKTVYDSVFGVFDNSFRPVRTRRHEIVALKYRGTMDYSSEAFYIQNAVQISLGQTDTVLELPGKLPIVDFDFLMFQLPRVFQRLRTGDSAQFYLVFPMGKRVERCTAVVGKGELVYFSGDTVMAARIYFYRPGYNSPISVWVLPDLTPIRYYDAASGYQLFLIPSQAASKAESQPDRKSAQRSKP